MLGSGFLIGQSIAWEQLSARGVYLNTNPSHGLFYVLTITHAVHAVGALIALFWVGVAAVRFRLGPAQAHGRAGERHLLAFPGCDVAVPDGFVSVLGMNTGERFRAANRREHGLPLILAFDLVCFAFF